MGVIFQKIFSNLPDRQYIGLYWRKKFHRPINLDNPEGFNEKLQWMKLYHRSPAYPSLVDKASAKEYAAGKIGEEFIIPTYGVWDRWEDIEWDRLPESFVMKPTHWGGGHNLVICPDKAALNRDKARRTICYTFDKNLYKAYREWPFKEIKPRIIAEKFIGDNPTDYKFFCFGGKAKYIMLCVDRFKGKKFYFFDRNWNFLRFDKFSLTLPADFTVPKPDRLEEMWDMADRLSSGLPFVRVDLYNTEGRLYFGEFTFFPCSGFDTTLLEEAETTLGNELILPEKCV